MTDAEQRYLDLVCKAISEIVETTVVSVTARTLANYAATNGDTISQTQAEKEFGRKWLHDLISVASTEQGQRWLAKTLNADTDKVSIFHQTVFVGDHQDAANRKKYFSRMQLAEIKRKMTTDVNISSKMGGIIYDMIQEGLDNCGDSSAPGQEVMNYRQLVNRHRQRLAVYSKKLSKAEERMSQTLRKGAKQ